MSADVDRTASLQSTVVTDLAGTLLELDSDMADITQNVPTESMLGGEGDSGQLLGEEETSAGKLGGLIHVEPDAVSGSSHIASSLGINPHTLQVNSDASTRDRKCLRTPPE